MSGKKKISYPIDLEFKVGKPIFFGGAEDKYTIHKREIDKIIELMNGIFRVGYVKRDRNYCHGINAHSLNEAVRERLKQVDGIEGETDVVFGSFLPPIHTKGEFDFSIYDKDTNFYNLWNHCYGKEAVRNGDEIIEYCIRDDKTSNEWLAFIEKQKPKKYEENLEIPSDADVFNIIGEIQFGNWAMVYKDMFRLVSAINKKAKIDLYVYVAADGNLKKLMSDGVVGFEDACKRFKENVENHNINKPVMILPLDVAFDLDTFDFSVAEEGYISICDEISKIEKKIDTCKKEIKKEQLKKRECKETANELKKIKDKINRLKKKKQTQEQRLAEVKNMYKSQNEFDEE